VHPELLRFRPAELRDLDCVHAIERAAWGEGAASREVLEHRLVTPGFETAIIEDRFASPVAFSQVVWTTLDALATSAGWHSIAFGTPCPTGEIAFGINASARPSREGLGGGSAALEAAINLVQRAGRRAFVACGRLPGYAHWSSRCDVTVYCRLSRYAGKLYVVDASGVLPWADDAQTPLPDVPPSFAASVRAEGRCVDPFVRMIHRVVVGGAASRLIGTVPNYFADSASGNWGLLYAWFNPAIVDDQVLEEGRVAGLLEGGMGLRRLASSVSL
jgi:hypothetical protein